MPGYPLRSVPDPPPRSADEVVDIAAEALDADLESAHRAAAVGTPAVVVAASLLDFLR